MNPLTSRQSPVTSHQPEPSVGETPSAPLVLGTGYWVLATASHRGAEPTNTPRKTVPLF